MLITRVLHVMSCYCYHKGTYFQANHNYIKHARGYIQLLLLPQRYVFSSKSQLPTISSTDLVRCYCYHKGTYFQANHNRQSIKTDIREVVIATTKVRIFKQITTPILCDYLSPGLLLLPQRYVFSSKSQQC